MAVSDFLEERFPEDLSFEFSGGPEFFTTVVAFSGGSEQRVVNWDQAKARYSAEHGLKDQEQLDALVAFFRIVRGKATGFRFRDWTDYASDMPIIIAQGSTRDFDDPVPNGATHQPLKRVGDGVVGLGDGSETQFQVIKRYSFGSATPFDREIKKPVAGTVRAYVDGVEQVITTDFTVDAATGIVTFVVAPPNGDSVEADFLFDVPVRFDADRMQVSLEHFNTNNWRDIKVVEVRL